MKKVLTVLLAGAFLLVFCAPALAAQPPADRRLYEKNLRYNKNAFPAGWQYEAGYTAWRIQRKLPANLNTYRKYRNDKVWRNKLHRYHRPEEILLDTLDWTVEEVALFMRQYQDYLKFHPAGYAD